MVKFTEKLNLQISDFHDFFYHSCIVIAIFKKDAVFNLCGIIENVSHEIFKINKYIARL